MKQVLIFGREPAVWIGLIESAIALAVAVGLRLSTDQVAAILAVVTAGFGVYVAYVTNETMLGVVVGLTKAVLALAIGFGLHLSPELTGAIIAFVTMGLSMFNRQNTSPLAVPTFATAKAKPVTVHRV